MIASHQTKIKKMSTLIDDKFEIHINIKWQQVDESH